MFYVGIDTYIIKKIKTTLKLYNFHMYEICSKHTFKKPHEFYFHVIYVV